MTRPPSDHFNGKRFFYPGPEAARGLGALLRWKTTSKAARWPARIPVDPAIPGPPPTGEEVQLTWIGQSTWLIRTHRSAWLTDPVFSNRVGPFGGVGPRRVAAPGVRLPDLPKIDAILLSHDHYDHCDLRSLQMLAEQHRPVIFAPLGFRALLPFATVHELDWWERLPGPGAADVQFVPAKHWGRRMIGGTNLRLWGGFYLRAGARTVYFPGDSGFDAELFARIRERCGPPDVALLPIGAYEPRWFMKDAHMNPAEAVAVHEILGSPLSLAMHWGTFQLTDEPWDAPPAALAEARENAGLPSAAFRVLKHGETAAI